MININISKLDKKEEALKHQNKIQKILRDNRDNIFLYSDGSKNDQLHRLGAGVYYTADCARSSSQSQSFSWNLGAGLEVFDAELFALEKAFKIAWDKKQKSTKKIWVFSDSQAAIKRLKNQSLKAGQYYVQSIKKWAKKFKELDILVYLEWVPGHMNVYGNEMADKAAKKGTELQRICPESYISLAFIKRKIKEAAMLEWTESWNISTKKGKHYSQFGSKPKWKIKEKAENKQIWSTYI